jgi:hypothetical protein
MLLSSMRFRFPCEHLLTLVALLFGLAVVPAARADHRDRFRDPLADQIEVVVIDREVVAIDAEGGGDRSAELSLREEVGFHAARGIVGVALTSERALFFSANRGWLSLRWLPSERVPERVLLGERVALLATSKRVIGFNAESGIAVDEPLGRNEPVHDLVIGANAGAALTSRRLLGLSLGSARFIEEKIGVSEAVESLDAGANIITATTPRRLLIFRASGATWEERPRRLR